MTYVRTVALPGPAVAAASDSATVWCAAEGRLLAYEESGSPLYDVEAPEGLTSLAAAGETLVGTVSPGIVVWLDPREGTLRSRFPVGGEPVVVAGGGEVWTVDVASGRGFRLGGEGARGEAVALADVDRLAPEATRLWWTSREDTILRGGDQPVDLGVGPGERGALAPCAGAIWTSVPDGLLRVGAWAAELGPPLAAPEGPVDHLACANGILVGASGRRGLFVLDPSIDADVRHLDVDLGGELAQLVAARSVAWAFPAGRAEARLVTVRLGE